MGWLVGYSIASMVAAYVVVRIVEVLLGGVLGGLVVVVKPVGFVVSWSAMTTYMGMRKVTSGARRARRSIVAMSNMLEKE